MLMSVSRHSYGQFYTIPDANFRNYLNSTYPLLLNGSQQLIIANAKNFTGSLSCASLNIQDLSGLQYFHKLTMLNCVDNPIGTLPSLDSMTAITAIWAEKCQLTTLPKINHLTALKTLVVKNNLLTSLPSLTGLVNLEYLDCSRNQLIALPSLNGLSVLQKMYCYENQLTQLPDLSSQINLQVLDCFNNKLTALPSLASNSLLEILKCHTNFIAELPALNALSNLKELSVHSNRLSTIPDLSGNMQLENIDVSKNKLFAISNLSSHSQLASVKMHNNQLSFSSLLPQVNHPSFSTIFTVSPQDTILNYPFVQINRNGVGIIPAGVDENVNSNSYAWYKNGVLLPGSTGSYISLNPPVLADSGYYLCKIQNSTAALAGITLIVRAAKVVIGPCIISSVYDYTIHSNKCVPGAEIIINENAMVSLYKPFRYELLSVNGQPKVASGTFTIPNVPPGTYDLKIMDQNNCSVSLNKFLKIPVPEDCDNIITPNGDGLDDGFFVESSGKAIIYTKEGKLVKEMVIPGQWDGTDNSGTLVPLGYYVIVINGHQKIGVVVLN